MQVHLHCSFWQSFQCTPWLGMFQNTHSQRRCTQHLPPPPWLTYPSLAGTMTSNNLFALTKIHFHEFNCNMLHLYLILTAFGTTLSVEVSWESLRHALDLWQSQSNVVKIRFQHGCMRYKVTFLSLSHTLVPCCHYKLWLKTKILTNNILEASPHQWQFWSKIKNTKTELLQM